MPDVKLAPAVSKSSTCAPGRAQSRRPADRAADFRHETVIPAAAADRIDRADAFRLILECRMRVIIQSAHEPRIDVDTECPSLRQMPAPASKCVRALLVQTVQNGRRSVKPVLIDLAIQYAQRIAVHPRLAILAQLSRIGRRNRSSFSR